jgi:predicted phage terminase large subunit-like protein
MEMCRRWQAGTGLIAFTEYTYEGAAGLFGGHYRAARHHREIAAHLERVERGEIDRLILLMPPRHGKTELAARRFPAWALGRRPGRQIITASATAETASDIGRSVRNLIESSRYRAVFPGVRLAEDSQAKNRWHTDAGGQFYALGIGGQIYGHGADIAIIDDPMGSWADAQSAPERKRVWEWYQGSVYNRLLPGGAIILIGHRTHEDDLAGMVLRSGSDDWTVVELKAISDDGEALWPEAYPLDALERIRANTMPRMWSALYQQSPAPDEGGYFRDEWLRIETPPDTATLAVYGASDYAVTEGGGDYTSHIVVGLDQSGRMYVLDVWRRQARPDVSIEAFCDLIAKWKPLKWGEERGQIKASLGPFLERRMRERKVYVQREAYPSKREKAVRAQSIRARMALSGLYLPPEPAWADELRSELLTFPGGRHDDQVDALSLIGLMLDDMVTGRKPPQSKPKRESGYRPLDDSGSMNPILIM